MGVARRSLYGTPPNTVLSAGVVRVVVGPCGGTPTPQGHRNEVEGREEHENERATTGALRTPQDEVGGGEGVM